MGLAAAWPPCHRAARPRGAASAAHGAATMQGPASTGFASFRASVSAGSRADAAAGARPPSMQAPRHQGQHPHGRCGAGRGCGAAHRDMPDMCSLGLCGDLLDCQLDCQCTASVMRLSSVHQGCLRPAWHGARQAFKPRGAHSQSVFLGYGICTGAARLPQCMCRGLAPGARAACTLVVEAQEGELDMATLCAQRPRSCSVRAGATYTGPLRTE